MLPPDECTLSGCHKPQDCFDLVKKQWAKRCRQHHKQPATVSKEVFAEQLKECVERARDAVAGGAQPDVALQLLLPLPFESSARSHEAAIAECRPFKDEVVALIFSLTSWKFNVDWIDKKRGNGPRFVLECAEDAKQNLERNGQPPGKKGAAKERRTVYSCNSSLYINFDLQVGSVGINLRHPHLHERYESRALSQAALAQIDEAVAKGGTEPKRIRAGLTGEAGDATADQVKWHVRQARAQQRGADAARRADETEEEHVDRLADRYSRLERVELGKHQDWEAVGFAVKGMEKVAGEAVEGLSDATHGLTQGGWELLVVFAEHRMHAYPIGFLFVRPSAARRGAKATKASRATRIRLFSSFFSALKTRLRFNPRIFHVDKDFAEIAALAKTWEKMKIQTCLWHIKKAILRRLQKGASQRVFYDPNEVRLVVPDVELEWKPSNAIIPQRKAAVLPAPRRIVLSEKSIKTYLSGPSAPSFAPEILAAFSTSTAKDDEDNDEDVDVLGRRDRTGEVEVEREEDDDLAWPDEEAEAAGAAEKGEAPEAASMATKRKAAERKGKKVENSSIGRSQANIDEILRRIMDHFCMHQLFPDRNGRRREPEAIYRSAASEMYRFCRAHNLVDAWAYLWSSWYRPGRWCLWARSTYHEIPVFRTTMGAESFFAQLKNTDMGGKKERRDLLHVIETINNKSLVRAETNLKNQHAADLSLNFRSFKSAWREDFVRFFRRWYEVEWAKRQKAEDGRAVLEKRMPVEVTKRSATSSKGVVLYPRSSFAGADKENVPIDPTLIAADRPYAILGGACSCPAFFRSRFLVCKHIVLVTVPKILGDDTVQDELTWFNVVERRRDAPFWEVPDLAVRAAIARKLGRRLETTPPPVEVEEEEGGGAGDMPFVREDFGGGFERGEGGDVYGDVRPEGIEDERAEEGEGADFGAGVGDEDYNFDHDDEQPDNDEVALKRAELIRQLNDLDRRELAIRNARIARGVDNRNLGLLVVAKKRAVGDLEREESEVGCGGLGEKRRARGGGSTLRSRLVYF